MSLYQQLSNGGGYSLPYLLHIYNTLTDVYVINDNADLTYGGHTYKASTFSYKPTETGAATLEIETVDANQLINIVEGADNFNVDAIGVLYDDTVTPINQYRHKYCSAEWDGRTMTLHLEADDRLDMTFPALLFTTYNNRGNA